MDMENKYQDVKSEKTIYMISYSDDEPFLGKVALKAGTSIYNFLNKIFNQDDSVEYRWAGYRKNKSLSRIVLNLN